jgi:putative transposase
MEMKDKQSFDFEAFKKQAASRFKKGETLLGMDGVFTSLPRSSWKRP